MLRFRRKRKVSLRLSPKVKALLKLDKMMMVRSMDPCSQALLKLEKTMRSGDTYMKKVLDCHKLINLLNSHKFSRVIDGTLVKQHSADLKTPPTHSTRSSMSQIYSQMSTSHTTMVSSGLMLDRVVATWLLPCSHKVSSGRDSLKYTQHKLREITSGEQLELPRVISIKVISETAG